MIYIKNYIDLNLDKIVCVILFVDVLVDGLYK